MNKHEILAKCARVQTPIFLACTRFTNKTWNENVCYRKKYEIPVAYGTDIRICGSYPMFSTWLVVEMNNDTNKIMGIGLIQNKLVFDKPKNIYTNHNYNRYMYHGQWWISRKTLCRKSAQLVHVLEHILFKGRGHVKRQTGISLISLRRLNECNTNDTDIVGQISPPVSCIK